MESKSTQFAPAECQTPTDMDKTTRMAITAALAPSVLGPAPLQARFTTLLRRGHLRAQALLLRP
jgi:hypothetical protein